MIELKTPQAEELDDLTLKALMQAGTELDACARALTKGGINVVGEILRGQGTFYEMDHYPEGDVYDSDHHAQYYYHAHREDAEEHGHFHTFLRGSALPDDMTPATGFHETQAWPKGEDAVAHLVAVSMDAWGKPIGLFATNRWVTDETWFSAEDVIRQIDRFQVDHAWPSWAVNLWLSALVRFYRPHIEQLLRHRDAVIARRHLEAPGTDVLEDRSLEITGQLSINPDQWQQELAREWRNRHFPAPDNAGMASPQQTRASH